MMPHNAQNEPQSVIVSRSLRPVTPNENDMNAFDSNGSLAELPKMHRSQSIPIASNKMRRTPSEVQLYEEEAQADWRDYVLYSRIVTGIQEAQQKTRDCRWRHANDVSLQHVYRTRHEEGSDAKTRWGLPDKLQTFSPDSLVGLMTHAYQDEEVMPFTLEM